MAIDDETIKVFGDGQIRRGFLYVDDCVQAILMPAICDGARGMVMNAGVDQPTHFVQLAETLIAVAGSGNWKFAPFSAERKAQEPGDFYSDFTRIRRIPGWEPVTNLPDGLAQTARYDRQYKAH